jgi:hypothetical protein
VRSSKQAIASIVAVTARVGAEGRTPRIVSSSGDRHGVSRRVRHLLPLVLAASLLAPASAVAAAPVILSAGEWAYSSTEEGIQGRIDPGGLTTEYDVEYSLATSIWCSSSGTEGSPEITTPARTLSGTLTGEEESPDLNVDLTGLTAGDTYCVQVAARNSSGTSHRPALTFTAGGPLITVSDTNATATSVQVFGTLNTPGGGPAEYYVSYGLASSGWCYSGGAQGSPEHQTPAQEFVPPTVSIGIEVTGLSPAMSYCEALFASNAWGSARSGPFAFTTLSGLASSPGDATPTGGATITTPKPTVPLLTHLAISPDTFKAAERGAPVKIVTRDGHATGATLTYWLNTASAIHLRVLRLEAGRTANTGRCVPQTKRNDRAHACALTVALPGGLSISGADGRNFLHFSGRLDGRALAPGHYRLQASAGTSSASASAWFQVLA